ncbi:hypothetical protein LCGC14_1309230 [marine sediment metagenome]|uniref:Uncharacterized protein n=1 Tax=marine sediment metagenome TaxID=412755 RepID=A0A0F9KND3_9ZZZZ
MSTPEEIREDAYELFSHEANLAGEHGNFTRSLARAAMAADSVNRDLLRFFWPQVISALNHGQPTKAPRRQRRARLLAVKIEHSQFKSGRWGGAGSCTGMFEPEPGARCSDCDATYFGAVT